MRVESAISGGHCGCTKTRCFFLLYASQHATTPVFGPPAMLHPSVFEFPERMSSYPRTQTGANALCPPIPAGSDTRRPAPSLTPTGQSGQLPLKSDSRRSQHQFIGYTYSASTGSTYEISCHYAPMLGRTTQRSWTFWDRLQRALKQRNLPTTQTAIARLVGVSQPSVYEWKHGGLPTLDNAIQLAEITGCCVEWLLTGRGPQIAQTPHTLAIVDIVSRLNNADAAEVLQFARFKLSSSP